MAGLQAGQCCVHSHREAAEAVEHLKDVSKPIDLDQVAISLVEQESPA